MFFSIFRQRYEKSSEIQNKLVCFYCPDGVQLPKEPLRCRNKRDRLLGYFGYLFFFSTRLVTPIAPAGQTRRQR